MKKRDDVVVRLTRSEAIALMSFLIRFRDDDVLSLEHHADRQILYNLCALVQNELGNELTSGNWKELLSMAQSEVLTDDD